MNDDRIEVRVPKALKKRLIKEAKKSKVKLSDLIRTKLNQSI